jgi:hypothetical protein
MRTDYMAEHRKRTDAKLTAAGFDVAKLTENQKDLITLPEDGPENYYCDGMLSRTKAKATWVGRLQRAGLTPEQIKAAIKLNRI